MVCCHDQLFFCWSLRVLDVVNAVSGPCGAVPILAGLGYPGDGQCRGDTAVVAGEGAAGGG